MSCVFRSAPRVALRFGVSRCDCAGDRRRFLEELGVVKGFFLRALGVDNLERPSLDCRGRTGTASMEGALRISIGAGDSASSGK